MPQPDGFDLHANVWVSASDRAGLERLCRFVLPPWRKTACVSRSDVRVVVALETAWQGGTTELVFEQGGSFWNGSPR